MPNIIICKACGGQVSSAAMTCPHCGQPLRKPPMKLGCVSVIFAGFVIVFVIALISNALNGSPPARVAPDATAADPPKSPEQIAREKATADALSESMVMLSVVRSTMRNPDSFKVERALQINDTNDVCFEYMAQNGFGGMNQGMAVFDAKTKRFKTDTLDGFRSLWRKDCVGKHGTEHTAD